MSKTIIKSKKRKEKNAKPNTLQINKTNNPKQIIIEKRNVINFAQTYFNTKIKSAYS